MSLTPVVITKGFRLESSFVVERIELRRPKMSVPLNSETEASTFIFQQWFSSVHLTGSNNLYRYLLSLIRIINRDGLTFLKN